MLLARLAAIGAAATLASAGVAHAVTGPVEQAPKVPSSPVSASIAPTPPTGGAPQPGAKGAKDAKDAKDASPLHSYLIGAGQYVLDVGTLSGQQTQPSTVSDVPLPGALWLFGSALLAFLGISSRRKL